jgi:glycosyltransferase involved in cell wall biosynthesis
MPVVSISHSHSQQAPSANWVSTVYNGIPKSNYTFQAKPQEGYLAFVGRLSPLKNPKGAIDIAVAADRPLKIAAKLDAADEPYFESQVKPYLSHPLIDFIGEVNEVEKNELMGNADALLFPITWPEPFGLVMTEAMACGTPVIAFNRGAVPEVLAHKKTGYIVNTVDEAVDALNSLPAINRQDCRAHFERFFSSERMAEAYNRLYLKQITQQNQNRVVKPLRRHATKQQHKQPVNHTSQTPARSKSTTRSPTGATAG